MATNTLHGSIDAWVAENYPNANHGDDNQLRLSADVGNIRRSFLFFSRPMPFTATIIQAKLRLKTIGTSWPTGSHTVTAKRVTQTWKEGKINWTNAPNSTATNQGTVVVSGNPAAKTQIEIDVTALLQDALAARAWYGIRLEVNTTGLHKFFGAEANAADTEPVLFVEWGVPPLAPTNLHPSDGVAVSDPTPILQWNFRDVEGDSDQAQARIMVDDVGDGTFATPTFDSGWVAVTDEQYDLGVGGMTPLTDGQQRWWRVAVRDSHGFESAWSEVYDFTYQTPGVLTITNPSAGTPVVEETTPPISWTFTGATQVSYRVRIKKAVQDVGEGWLWDSGRVASTALSVTPPKHIITDSAIQYFVEVRIWDSDGREGLPGAPAYVEAGRLFNFTPSGVPSTVPSLTATVEEAVVRLDFSRAIQPDYFAIKVDGKIVEDLIDPTDIFVSGTSYRYYYHGAKPRVQHTYEVVAVTLGSAKLQRSTGNATANATTNPRGIWLLEHSTDMRVVLLGETARDLSIGEDAETYYPVARRDPVRITSALRGYEGSVSGQLEDWPTGTTAKTYRDRLEDMKGGLGDSDVRLVVGDMNIAVVLGDVTISPARAGDRYNVTAEVFQTGNYTFDVNG